MKVKKLVLSAMFLAIAFVLPFFTGQIPQVGGMLCPMHIPALLCGFFCGGPYGALVGFLAPIFRSLVMGMPTMFPKAVCMAVEMATYGLVAGMLYRLLCQKKWAVYASLVTAMIVGRLLWGMAMFICMGIKGSAFGLAAFWAGAVTTALPGIVLQLVLIPILVLSLKKHILE